MATQTVEFSGPTGETITAKLFDAGSDTVVASVASTEATNRKGVYSAAYTDVAAGTYRLIGLDASSVPLCRWWVTLTLTTATFQSYEIPYAPIANVLTSALPQSYAADGAEGTLAQLLYMIQQRLNDAAISGTTMTVRKLDGTTPAATFTLDDALNPLDITRAS